MKIRDGFKLGALAASAILVLSLLGGSFYTIDQGERGVLLRFGAVTGTAQPGLGWKVPFVATVAKISTQSHVAEYPGMHTYSRDQQPAVIKLTVSYHVPADKVAAVYERYGTVDAMVKRLVDPHVFQQAKNVFGQFNAVRAIQERGDLNGQIHTAIERAAEGADGLVTIESVQVENVDFSDAYEKSVEQRMLAEVEVQRLKQNADREKVQAEITVTQARAKADAVRANAQAEADAIRLRGEAEAGAIKARAAALAENQNLVALTQAERWDGKLPATMVPGSGVPMLNLGR